MGPGTCQSLFRDIMTKSIKTGDFNVHNVIQSNVNAHCFLEIYVYYHSVEPLISGKIKQQQHNVERSQLNKVTPYTFLLALIDFTIKCVLKIIRFNSELKLFSPDNNCNIPNLRPAWPA